MRRNEIDAGSQPIRNLFTNPAFESVSSSKDLTIRTNYLTNPSMRTTSVTPQVMRTNLISNPAMELSSGNIAVRTNFCNNPGGEYSTSNTNVRVNLVNSPRGVSALSPYGTNHTVTPNVTISGHPQGFTTAIRVSYDGSSANPGVILLPVPDANTSYYMSAWVYHETVAGGTQAFAQAGITSQPDAPAIVQGVWQKVSWIRQTSGTSSIGFRVSASSGTGSYLITGMQIEKATIAMPYFDALTTSLNLLTNPSMEASTGATTVRTNYCPNPRAVTTNGFTAMTPTLTTMSNGVSALQSLANGTNTAYLFSPRGTIAVAAGETYTLSATVEFSSNIKLVYIRANRRSTNEYFTSGAIMNYDPTGKGVHRISITFTAPSSISADDLCLSLNFFAAGGAVAPAGDWVKMGQILIEKVGSTQPYFDGTTSASTDFTYSWAGTADYSASYQRGTNVANWGAQWYGSGGGTGYFYRSSGTGMAGGYSARKYWTSDNTTNSLDVGITNTISVVPGATYTSSIFQRSSFSSALTCYVVWKDSAGTTIATTPRTAYATTPAGSWVRASCTETAPSGAYTGTFVYGPYANSGTISAGSYIDWDWAMVEETDKLNPYYDGTAAAPDDFTYLWNGTANNSTSLQRAAYPFGYGPNTSSGKIYQTGTISHLGTKAIVAESVAPTGYSNGMNFVVNNLPAGTYTFSAYVYLPQAYGTSGIAAVIGHSGGLVRGNNVTTIGSWQRTKATVTTTSTQNVWFYLITDGVSSVPSGSRFYADSLQIEAGGDASPYFDGTNAITNLIGNSSFETNTSGWSGAGSPVGVVSQDSSPAYSGTKSLKVVCDGSAANQGAYTSGKSFVKPNRWYTASVWVYGDVGKTVKLELGEWDDGVNIVGSRTSSSAVVLTSGWQRITVSRLMGATASLADIVVRNSNAVAHTFWIDAAQLEEGASATDYSNATFTYAWTGTTNNSTSEQRGAAVTGISYTSPVAPYQSSEQVFNGSKSLYLEGSSADIGNSTFAGPTVSGLTIGTTYTYSAWVFVLPGSVGVELQPSGISSVASGRSTTTGRWERIYHTFDAVSTSHILRIRTTNNGKVQVYIGATLLEQGNTVLPYFDGTNPAYENIAWPTTSAMTGTTITTGVAYNGMIWSRATVVTGTGGTMARNIVQLNKLVKGQPYTVSVTVANDGATTVTGALDWCDGPSTGYTLAPGETKRISTTGTGLASRGYDSVYRFADLTINQSTTQQNSVLFKDWLIEAGSTVNNYYTGTGDFTYAWSGTANASTSSLRSTSVVGLSANRNSSLANTRFWAYQSTDETGRKVAKWLSPAGTPDSSWRVAGINNMDYANIQAGKAYTMYMRYRATNYPASAIAPVQICDPSNQNQVMGALTGYALNLGTTGWQIYRRVFTANISASASTIVYLNLPTIPDPALDQTLEISEAFIVDNSHSGAFFDGSTVSADPDFAYAWNGTPDASTSKMLGTTVTNTYNTITHGQGVASTAWKSSGAYSLRILAKNSSNNDSFVDLKPMISGGTLKPNTKYTVAGTRYLSAPLTGTFVSWNTFRVNAGGDLAVAYRNISALPNTVGAARIVATFKTNDTTVPSFLRIHNGSMEGNGDVWWDDLMLVEGDYDGRHIDGTLPNAKWDGTAHASTSVGYPTTLEALIGMPLFSATSGGNWALDSSKLPSTGARTFYTVADSKPLSTGGIDVIWVYGQDNLSDSPTNQTITFRYQSENTGNSNSILARRTGGAGAIRAGVPSPARYIMVGGLDQNGYLFSGHPASPTLATDNLKMSIPHERFQVYADNPTHTHVATYIYPGVHDAATRALVYKLLAQRHNVPLLV